MDLCGAYVPQQEGEMQKHANPALLSLVLSVQLWLELSSHWLSPCSCGLSSPLIGSLRAAVARVHTDTESNKTWPVSFDECVFVCVCVRLLVCVSVCLFV